MLVNGDLRMSEVYVTGVIKQDKSPLPRDAREHLHRVYEERA